MQLSAEKASRRHARVLHGPDGLVIEDVGSTHGTSINGGEAFHGESRPLAPGDRIEIAGAVVRILAGGETRFEPEAAEADGAATAPLPAQSATLDGGPLSIGRQEGNDLVLPDPNVSRAHAELVAGDAGVDVVDLGSRNGTRLDGVPVERARVEPGSVIGVGQYQLHFDGTRLTARDSRAELRLSARNIAVRVGADKTILKPVSIDIEPGELVVLIGQSGAGKSTMLKVLAGVNAPSRGAVTVNGEPLGTRLTDVGYVPQDEIVHPLLTVREALRYAARLRLPQDTSAEEIDATVNRVVAELSLERNADTPIGSLSGGQRKRTGVAAELLSRPSLLFLDEPTTGLDPGLEGRLMKLLRELADGGRGVTVVTHATSSLTLVDRIVVMARGGERAFEGSPADALAFFGVGTFEEIYEALDTADPAELRARFESGAPGRRRPRARGGARRPRERPAAAPEAAQADARAGGAPGAAHAARPAEPRARVRSGAGARPAQRADLRYAHLPQERRQPGRRDPVDLPARTRRDLVLGRSAPRARS